MPPARVITFIPGQKCPHCEYVAYTWRTWERHRRKHMSEKRFACSLCDYRTDRKENLNKHASSVHMDEKPFECPTPGCGYRSSYRRSIAHHVLRVHSGVRAFACDCTGCSFRGISKGEVLRHVQRVHQKTKRAFCHLCDFAAFDKFHLRQHVECVHVKEGHRIEDCDLCVHLKKDERMSAAMKAAQIRKNSMTAPNKGHGHEHGTTSQAGITQDVETRVAADHRSSHAANRAPERNAGEARAGKRHFDQHACVERRMARSAATTRDDSDEENKSAADTRVMRLERRRHDERRLQTLNPAPDPLLVDQLLDFCIQNKRLFVQCVRQVLSKS